MRKLTDDDPLYEMLLKRERENREREKAKDAVERILKQNKIKKFNDWRRFQAALEEEAAKQRALEALKERRRIDRERIKKNAEEYDQIIAAQDVMHDITGGSDGAVSSGATAGTQGAAEALQGGGDGLPEKANSDLGSAAGKGR